MRTLSLLLSLGLMLGCNTQKKNEQEKIHESVYTILIKTGDRTSESEVPGKVDSVTVNKLNEPLKAMAAFYAAMGGTLCDGEYCGLTSVLGLGKQGSGKHKNLILKFFPNDKVAETVVAQNCYLRPSGASSFSDFEFLTFTERKDTLQVDYNLMHYNKGEVQWIKGPDLYVYKDNQFEKISRNLWTFAEN